MPRERAWTGSRMLQNPNALSTCLRNMQRTTQGPIDPAVSGCGILEVMAPLGTARKHTDCRGIARIPLRDFVGSACKNLWSIYLAMRLYDIRLCEIMPPLHAQRSVGKTLFPGICTNSVLLWSIIKKKRSPSYPKMKKSEFSCLVFFGGLGFRPTSLGV